MGFTMEGIEMSKCQYCELHKSKLFLVEGWIVCYECKKERFDIEEKNQRV